MSSLLQQCEFMSGVVQHAIVLGMSREQFDKLADTAWLVLTAEREQPEPPTCICCPVGTAVVANAYCPVCSTST